jgi:hypothetical protein
MAPPPSNGDSTPRNLPSVGKDIVVHHDELKSIHKRLQADLDLYDGWGAGTLNDFQDQAGVGKDALGDYPAAHGVSMTCQNAYNHIGSTYDQFLTAYKGVIDAIKKTADNYGKAEEDNVQRAKNVYHDGQPSTGNSGSWG